MHRRLYIEAYALLVLHAVRLRLFGPRKALRLLESADAGSTGSPAPEEPLVVGFALDALTAADRAVPLPTGCLVRSIALHRLLRRRGISTSLRIGVRRSAGALEAHAWLEAGGEPLDDGIAAFSPLRPMSDRQVIRA